MQTTWDAAQRKGSLSIYIWESTDLINWGSERLVKVENDQAGMVWAPDAIWDASKGKTNYYFLDTVNDADYYFKINIWSIGHPNLYVTCCLLLIACQPEL